MWFMINGERTEHRWLPWGSVVIGIAYPLGRRHAVVGSRAQGKGGGPLLHAKVARLGATGAAMRAEK